jgi:hypothetical protein
MKSERVEMSPNFAMEKGKGESGAPLFQMNNGHEYLLWTLELSRNFFDHDVLQS